MKDKFSNEFELKVSAKDYDYSALKLQKYCQDNLPKLGKNEETSCSIYVQSSTNYSLEFPTTWKPKFCLFKYLNLSLANYLVGSGTIYYIAKVA